MQKFMVFCLLVSFLVFPVSATGSEYVSRDTFWNWAAGSNGVIKQVINFVGGLGTCSKSDDTYHHASSYFKEGNVDGEVRYRCICDLCGDSFTAYEKDLQQSYDAQVAELPAPTVTATGHLIWNTWDSFTYTGRFYASGDSHSFDSFPCSYDHPSYNRTQKYNIASSGNYIVATFTNVLFTNVSSRYFGGITTTLTCPISGSYCLLSTKEFDFTGITSDGNQVTSSGDYTQGSNFAHYNLGDGLSVYSRCNQNSPGLGAFSGASRSFVIFNFYFPFYEIIPDSAIDITSGDTYNIQSRPTSITGDYGIIGDNGQIIKVEGDKIVNETNNTYYNPSTGQTVPITDWSYNYEDRSYTVTTESGDTVTITYGDENVVIKEGDTTYNVYYLVNGSGSEDPGPDVPPACDHTWTETSRTDPTCTTAGKVTSTCSKCNQTKTEPIPATGHTWVVDRTVQTEYDEDGNLVQQGYTIYSCSVCGEQYKDMEGTGPPGQEEEKSIWEKIGDLIGTVAGGFLGLIEAVLSKILDALTSLAEMLMGKLKTVVETVLSIFDELPALFGGFLDFLGAIFPFLPPEITTILTFGVIAVVFIGILKAVRR